MTENSKPIHPEDTQDAVTTMYTKVNDELGARYQPFLNYGYFDEHLTSSTPILEECDREFHISAQLYFYVVSLASLAGKNVVEIGSGRGGGAYYLKKYLQAKNVVGLEYLAQSVEISKKTFPNDGLSFIRGDAGNLPFSSNSKDFVVNIESSHCYPSLADFYSETHRILKPDGYFFYADLLTLEKKSEAEETLSRSPFKNIKTADITHNVLASLQRDNDRKIELIKSMKLDQNREKWWIDEWACVGTKIWSDLCEGRQMYVHYVLIKD